MDENGKMENGKIVIREFDYRINLFSYSNIFPRTEALQGFQSLQGSKGKGTKHQNRIANTNIQFLKYFFSVQKE